MIGDRAPDWVVIGRSVWSVRPSPQGFDRTLPQVAADLQLDLLAAVAALEDRRLCTSARSKELRCLLHVAERCRQGDTDDSPSQDDLKPVEQGTQLDAALGADERMELIDHDEAEAGEQSGHLGSAAYEECLERFRGDKHHPLRLH